MHISRRVFFKAFVRNKLEFFLNIHIYGGPSLAIKKIKIKLKKKLKKIQKVKIKFIQKKKNLPWPMSTKSDTLGITKNGFYSIASKNFSS